MAASNVTNQAAALKIFYLEGFREQINTNTTLFYKEMEMDMQSVVGGEVRMNLRYGRTGGIGNRADDADLPTPNARKSIEARFPTKNIYANMQISEKAIEASKSSQGAYAKLLETTLEETMVDAKEDINRQLYGTQLGTLGTVKTIISAPTNTIAITGNIRRFAEGKFIDVLTVTGTTITTTKATALEITGVDLVNGTITVTPNIAAAAVGDIIVITSNFNAELTGLEDIFTANNTIYNVDRNTYKFFNAGIKNVGGALNLKVLEEVVDNARQATTEMPTHILAALDTKREYSNLLQSQKRFNDTQEYKGGQKMLMFEDLPVVPDRYQKSGILDVLAIKNFKRYTMKDWDWLDKDGALLSRVPNKAVYGATLSSFMEIACDKPASQYRMSGITVS